MIVVDTSALIAILEEEHDAVVYAEAIAEADPPLISAASFVEAGIVMLNRHGPKAMRMLDEVIRDGGVRIEGVTGRHAHMALEAYARYGKGQKTAGLNFGDCFYYALAKATGLPLLFKGGNFSKTDIEPVL
jgi:ribonuclease VapC